jgi:hypothetical protein
MHACSVHAESKKKQKFVFRSTLRPNQISFSHGQLPTRTLGLAQKSPRIGLRGTLREHPPRGDLSPAFGYRRAFCPSDAAGDWHDRRTIRRRSVV